MLLTIENLKVAYGPIEVLHGISLQVAEGEIVTLIGANGAGKSTTLMSIMRLAPPEAPTYLSGRLEFDGSPGLRGLRRRRVSPARRVRRRTRLGQKEQSENDDQ